MGTAGIFLLSVGARGLGLKYWNAVVVGKVQVQVHVI
jgi:hypothetical protein